MSFKLIQAKCSEITMLTWNRNEFNDILPFMPEYGLRKFKANIADGKKTIPEYF